MERPIPTLHGLRARVRGAVLAPGDAQYAAECGSFNTAVTHTPEAAVLATSVDAVRECVHFARERGVAVHVKGGGHGDIPITSGLLISTRALNDVRTCEWT
jgi:hypothetical protein